MQSPKNAISAPFWAQKALSGSLPPTIRLNYWWFWNIPSIVGLPSRALCAAPTCKENFILVTSEILWSRPMRRICVCVYSQVDFRVEAENSENSKDV